MIFPATTPCPDCSVELERRLSGIAHGCIPEPDDLLIEVGFVRVNFGLMWWILQ